jgi:hypothetical protein
MMVKPEEWLLKALVEEEHKQEIKHQEQLLLVNRHRPNKEVASPPQSTTFVHRTFVSYLLRNNAVWEAAVLAQSADALSDLFYRHGEARKEEAVLDAVAGDELASSNQPPQLPTIVSVSEVREILLHRCEILEGVQGTCVGESLPALHSALWKDHTTSISASVAALRTLLSTVYDMPPFDEEEAVVDRTYADELVRIGDMALRVRVTEYLEMCVLDVSYELEIARLSQLCCLLAAEISSHFGSTTFPQADALFDRYAGELQQESRMCALRVEDATSVVSKLVEASDANFGDHNDDVHTDSGDNSDETADNDDDAHTDSGDNSDEGDSSDESDSGDNSDESDSGDNSDESDSGDSSDETADNDDDEVDVAPPNPRPQNHAPPNFDTLQHAGTAPSHPRNPFVPQLFTRAPTILSSPNLSATITSSPISTVTDPCKTLDTVVKLITASNRTATTVNLATWISQSTTHGVKVIAQHGSNAKGFGGFAAEIFLADSYNLSAIFNKSSWRAVVSSSIKGCGKAPYDIVIVHADNVAHLTKNNVGVLGKAFVQAKTGPKAMSYATNPKYRGLLFVGESSVACNNTLSFGGNCSLPINTTTMNKLRLGGSGGGSFITKTILSSTKFSAVCGLLGIPTNPVAFGLVLGLSLYRNRNESWKVIAKEVVFDMTHLGLLRLIRDSVLQPYDASTFSHCLSLSTCHLGKEKSVGFLKTQRVTTTYDTLYEWGGLDTSSITFTTKTVVIVTEGIFFTNTCTEVTEFVAVEGADTLARLADFVRSGVYLARRILRLPTPPPPPVDRDRYLGTFSKKSPSNLQEYNQHVHTAMKSCISVGTSELTSALLEEDFFSKKQFVRLGFGTANVALYGTQDFCISHASNTAHNPWLRLALVAGPALTRVFIQSYQRQPRRPPPNMANPANVKQPTNYRDILTDLASTGLNAGKSMKVFVKPAHRVVNTVFNKCVQLKTGAGPLVEGICSETVAGGLGYAIPVVVEVVLIYRDIKSGMTKWEAAGQSTIRMSAWGASVGTAAVVTAVATKFAWGATAAFVTPLFAGAFAAVAVSYGCHKTVQWNKKRNRIKALEVDLEFEPTITLATIKHRARKAALKYHPDKGGSNESMIAYNEKVLEYCILRNFKKADGTEIEAKSFMDTLNDIWIQISTWMAHREVCNRFISSNPNIFIESITCECAQPKPTPKSNIQLVFDACITSEEEEPKYQIAPGWCLLMKFTSDRRKALTEVQLHFDERGLTAVTNSKSQDPPISFVSLVAADVIFPLEIQDGSCDVVSVSVKNGLQPPPSLCSIVVNYMANNAV